LLKVHGKPLLAFPLEALARSGVQSVVTNTGCHLCHPIVCGAVLAAWDEPVGFRHDSQWQ
jgi:hypothetical protein